jgi:hypothetical protein
MQDSQMGFGIVTTTETSDDPMLHVGEQPDDAPRMELIDIRHSDFHNIAFQNTKATLQKRWLGKTGQAGIDFSGDLSV